MAELLILALIAAVVVAIYLPIHLYLKWSGKKKKKK